MGKKGAKRKTRWRTLSIGAPPGEEDEEEEVRNGYGRIQEGGTVTRSGVRHAQSGYKPRRQYNGSYANSTSGNYGGPYNGQSKSNRDDTPAEPKIVFNEEEYTRITTPRQDVLFKKGYLTRKKPHASTASTSATPSTIESQSASHSTADGSETTEDQQLLDRDSGNGGEFCTVPCGLADQSAPQFALGGFYDQSSGYYYEYPVMLVAPPVPGHPNVVPNMLAAMPCGPVPLRPVEWFNPHFMPQLMQEQHCAVHSTDSQAGSPESSVSMDEPGCHDVCPEMITGTGSGGEEETNEEANEDEARRQTAIAEGGEVALQEEEEEEEEEVEGTGEQDFVEVGLMATDQQIHISHMPPPPHHYIYPGHFMFGPPMINVNGVTVQSGAIVGSGEIGVAAASKRKKKKKRRKQKRPPVSGTTEDEEEEYSSEWENGPSWSKVSWNKNSTTNWPLNPEVQEFQLRPATIQSETNSDDNPCLSQSKITEVIVNDKHAIESAVDNENITEDVLHIEETAEGVVSTEEKIDGVNHTGKTTESVVQSEEKPGPVSHIEEKIEDVIQTDETTEDVILAGNRTEAHVHPETKADSTENNSSEGINLEFHESSLSVNNVQETLKKVVNEEQSPEHTENRNGIEEELHSQSAATEIPIECDSDAPAECNKTQTSIVGKENNVNLKKKNMEPKKPARTKRESRRARAEAAASSSQVTNSPPNTLDLNPSTRQGTINNSENEQTSELSTPNSGVEQITTSERSIPDSVVEQSPTLERSVPNSELEQTQRSGRAVSNSGVEPTVRSERPISEQFLTSERTTSSSVSQRTLSPGRATFSFANETTLSPEKPSSRPTSPEINQTTTPINSDDHRLPESYESLVTKSTPSSQSPTPNVVPRRKYSAKGLKFVREPTPGPDLDLEVKSDNEDKVNDSKHPNHPALGSVQNNIQSTVEPPDPGGSEDPKINDLSKSPDQPILDKLNTKIDYVPKPVDQSSSETVHDKFDDKIQNAEPEINNPAQIPVCSTSGETGDEPEPEKVVRDDSGTKPSDHPITEAVADWLRRANSPDMFKCPIESETDDEDEDDDHPKNLQGNPTPALSASNKVDVDDVTGGKIPKTDATTTVLDESSTMRNNENFFSVPNAIDGRELEVLERSKGTWEGADKDRAAGVRVAQAPRIDSYRVNVKRRRSRVTEREEEEKTVEIKHEISKTDAMDVVLNHSKEESSVMNENGNLRSVSNEIDENKGVLEEGDKVKVFGVAQALTSRDNAKRRRSRVGKEVENNEVRKDISEMDIRNSSEDENTKFAQAVRMDSSRVSMKIISGVGKAEEKDRMETIEMKVRSNSEMEAEVEERAIEALEGVKTFERGEIVVSLSGKLLPGTILESLPVENLLENLKNSPNFVKSRKNQETPESIPTNRRLDNPENHDRLNSGKSTAEILPRNSVNRKNSQDGRNSEWNRENSDEDDTLASRLGSLGSIEEPDVLECWEAETVEPVVDLKKNATDGFQVQGILQEGEATEEDYEEPDPVNRDHVRKYYRLARECTTSVEEDVNSRLSSPKRTLPNSPERMIESLCSEEIPVIIPLETTSKVDDDDDESNSQRLEVEEAFEVYESCYNEKPMVQLGNVTRSCGQDEDGPVPCRAVCCNIQDFFLRNFPVRNNERRIIDITRSTSFGLPLIPVQV